MIIIKLIEILSLILTTLVCVSGASSGGNCSNSAGRPPDPPIDPYFGFPFQCGPTRGLHQQFINSSMEIILNKCVIQDYSTEPIVYFKPDQLARLFDFSLQEHPIPNAELLLIIENLFKISPRPFHRFRLTRRVSGLDPLSLVGDWMGTIMSNLVVIYELSPVFTIMELKMTEYLCQKIGWSQTGDGVPTSGAGTANLMALNTALFYVDKTIRDIGIAHVIRPLVIYVSQHASISWNTAALYNGIGTNAVVKIPVDQWGRMDVAALSQQISNDKNIRIPILVVATAGTPILGAIDPIDEIARICKANGIWLHVDAEFGGGYLFTSGKFLNKLKGISGADSVSISMWHFATPYVTSMLLTKNPDALSRSFNLHAPYLFTELDLYNKSYDRGDHTIQASRRPEISKIWFAASRGESHSFELFSLMEKNHIAVIKYLKTRAGFELVRESEESVLYQVPLLSFYYVPKALRRNPQNQGTVDQITKTTLKIKKIIQERGLLDISVSYMPGTEKSFPAFFTMSLTNTRFAPADMRYVADTIEIIGESSLFSLLLPTFKFPVIGPQQKIPIKYPNFPDKGIYQKFFRDIMTIGFAQGIFFSRKERVSNFKQPEYFDRGGGSFDFKLPYQPGSRVFAKLRKAFTSIIEYTPHWAHPYLIWQLSTGLDPYTMVADLIVPVLNTAVISYSDGSAPFVLMENELVKQLTKRVFHKEGDGIIVDGGSMANQISIALAKYAASGDAFKSRGIRSLNGKKYIVYLSLDAHYSTIKGSMFQGIGINNSIEISTTNIGKMVVSKLTEAVQKTLQEGNVPLMVVITAGTTVYGAIDPIEEIVDVCTKYKIWCHVDGAFGGLAVMSDKHIALFKGIERVDSVGADLHKLMGSAMVCTIFLTPHKGILRKTFSLEGETQEEPDWEAGLTNNLVGRHAQMDKRNNILKFWLLWKAKGRFGLGAHVDRIMRNKEYVMSEIRRRENEGFELIIDPFELTNVCFLYIPRELNPKCTNGVDRNSPEWKAQMDMFTFSIEKEFAKNGIILLVTQNRVNADGTDTVTFIKFILMGSALTKADLRFLLDAVAYYGSKIKVSQVAQNAEVTNEQRQKIKNNFDPFGNLPKYYSPK